MFRYLFVALFLTISLSAAEFIVTTMPKTGSHLLIPILEKLTEKKACWIPSTLIAT